MKKIFSASAALLLLFLFFPLSIVRGAVVFGPASVIEHRSKSVSPPAAVIDGEGRVFVSWIEEGKEANAIYIAVSNDYGATFLPEVKVNGTEDEPAAIHESPVLALGPGNEIYLAWASKADAPFTADLRLARSAVDKLAFGPSIKVNDNRAPASIGFYSMTIGPDGAVYMAWLDGREKETRGPATYFAASSDNGKSFGENRAVDYNSCPCCRTAIAYGNGRVFVAWRKVYPGNIREIVVSSAIPGGNFSKPVMVGKDYWEIAGCPHRGPSIKVKENAEVLVAWYAEIDGDPSIFYASSADNGARFEKVLIRHKRSAFPDNVVMALKGNDAVFSWQEITPVLSNIIFEARDGDRRVRIQLNDDPRKATNPVISVNKKGEVLVAWQKMDVRNAKTLIRVWK